MPLAGATVRAGDYGVIGTPTTSAAAGTSTADNNTEVRDAVLGDYVFTAVAGALYVVRLAGAWIGIGTASVQSRWLIRCRDGGAATPTTASPLVHETAELMSIQGGAGQRGFAFESIPMTFSVGTHTLSMFIVRSTGTGVTGLMLNTRSLYVERKR
jgi:hypothetical protein